MPEHEDKTQLTPEEAQHLAQEEKHAGVRLWLGNQGYWLLGVLLVYLVSLFLPFVTGVPGWKVVFLHPDAAAAHVKVTEYAFAILSFLGAGVFTILTLVLRRSRLALIAWVFVCVSVVAAILAIWLRQTRPAAEEAISGGMGMFLAAGCVIVAVAAYSSIILRRDDHQLHLAHQRAQVRSLDAVGRLQEGMLAQQRQASVSDDNPLLVDDRRARASRRHKNSGAERNSPASVSRAGEDSTPSAAPEGNETTGEDRR